MPKKSFRSRMNEAKSGGAVKANKPEVPVSSSGEQRLQSCLGSAEMKRQLADALKEPSSKNRNKRDKNRLNNNGGEFKRKNVLGEISLTDQSIQETDAKKMVYADAVRNSLGMARDVKNSIDKSTLTNNNKVNSDDMYKSDEHICDISVKDENGNNKLIEVLTEEDCLEEDNTWELVSTGDCSDEGREEEEEEEQFTIVTEDGLPDKTAMTISDTDNKENKLEDKENQATKEEPKKNNTANTTPTKKKIIITRKYIGGPDLPEKLSKLGFASVKPKESDEDQQDEDEKNTVEQWNGTYRATLFEVEAKRRCGLLVTTVRATSESLLIGLNSLQGLIEETGLLSYATLSVPSILTGGKTPGN